MKLAERSAQNPAAVAAAAAIVLLFGTLALLRLPIQLLPDTRQPQLFINASWREAAPSEIEEALVEPIEEAMRGISGLLEMRSESNRGFGNVGLKESNVPAPTAPGFEWEYFHVNSAEVLPDGNFLISARNTSAIYKIDRVTGKIIWRLGGKKSDFKLGAGVRFDWQHSARTQPDGTIKIYDNSAAPPTRARSAT